MTASLGMMDVCGGCVGEESWELGHAVVAKTLNCPFSTTARAPKKQNRNSMKSEMISKRFDCTGQRWKLCLLFIRPANMRKKRQKEDNFLSLSPLPTFG